MSENFTPVLYTARGHGSSTGWQSTAASNLQQFIWCNLSRDLLALAVDHIGCETFVAAGSSMGSATALYAAIQEPDRVRGVIMARPPTAWQERSQRRRHLRASADRCQSAEEELLQKKRKEMGSSKYFEADGDVGIDNSGGDIVYHCVLRGAASPECDLPALDSEVEAYKRVTCPVLLLALSGDDSHPLSTATALHQVLPQASLHIAEDEMSAIETWPSIISSFLQQISQG